HRYLRPRRSDGSLQHTKADHIIIFDQSLQCGCAPGAKFRTVLAVPDTSPSMEMFDIAAHAWASTARCRKDREVRFTLPTGAVASSSCRRNLTMTTVHHSLRDSNNALHTSDHGDADRCTRSLHQIRCGLGTAAIALVW